MLILSRVSRGREVHLICLRWVRVTKQHCSMTFMILGWYLIPDTFTFHRGTSFDETGLGMSCTFNVTCLLQT